MFNMHDCESTLVQRGVTTPTYVPWTCEYGQRYSLAPCIGTAAVCPGHLWKSKAHCACHACHVNVNVNANNI